MPKPRNQKAPSGEVELLDPEFLAFDDAEDRDAEVAQLLRDAGDYE